MKTANIFTITFLKCFFCGVFAIGLHAETSIDVKIDSLVEKKYVALAGEGLVTRCSKEESLERVAVNAFNNGTAFLWTDINSALKDYHYRLGFIDLIVTVKVTYNPDFLPLANSSQIMWIQDRDRESITASDIRAYSDGVIYEMIDNNYKWTESWAPSFNNNFFTMAVYPETIVVMRMGAPDGPVPTYTYFNNNIELENISQTPSIEVKALAYTPLILPKYETNKIIPFVEILAPANAYDYRTENTLDSVNQYRDLQKKGIVTIGLPTTFSAAKSYFGSRIAPAAIAGAKYSWDFGDGTTLEKTSDATAVHVYEDPGDYVISLSIQVGTAFGENNGTTTTPNTLEAITNYSPIGLPFKLVAEQAPPESEILPLRPNPFIAGEHTSTEILMELVSDSKVSVQIIDFFGTRIKTLFDGDCRKGFSGFSWDCRDALGNLVNSGGYFVIVVVNNETHIQKLQVLY